MQLEGYLMIYDRLRFLRRFLGALQGVLLALYLIFPVKTRSNSQLAGFL